jgi:hypothetical protein
MVRKVLYGSPLCLVEDLKKKRQETSSTDRPIVFVAHSLGGLLVKAALIICHESTDLNLRSIELCTVAVHFFGTPFSGMTSPSFSKSLASIFRMSSRGRAKSNTVITVAEYEARWLETKLQAFKPLVRDIEVFSYYEKQDTPGYGLVGAANFRRLRESYVYESLPLQIVDRQPSFHRTGSGLTNSSTRSIRTDLDRDHAHLMTFQKKDKTYGSLKDQICHVVDMGHKRSKERILAFQASTLGMLPRRFLDKYVSCLMSSTANPLIEATMNLGHLSNLPRLPAVPIIERHDLVEPLLQYLADVPSQHAGFPLLLLNGSPGTGKSTLALSLAHQLVEKHSFSFAYWIDAESPDTIIIAYLELVRSLLKHHDGATSGKAAVAKEKLGIKNIESMMKATSIAELDEIEVKAVVQGVKDWLLRAESHSWVLVFDNVTDPFDIVDLLPLGLTGRIILTAKDTRRKLNIGKAVEVPAMSNDEAVCLLKSYTPEDALHALDGKSSIISQIFRTRHILMRHRVCCGAHSGKLEVSTKIYCECGLVYAKETADLTALGLLE